MTDHDCLSLYQHGETTPWTCPQCGQVWAVRDARWIKVGPPPDAAAKTVPYDVHEREMLAVIAERDQAQEWADTLASLLAPPEVLGEHSSHNNPWQNAVDHARTGVDGG